MRLLLLVIPILMFNLGLTDAHNLKFFNLDCTKYPFVSSKFSIADNNGKQISDLNKDDFVLTSNSGNILPILNLSCTTPSPQPYASVVLTFDISGSMVNSGELLKKLGNTWVDLMKPEYSECAVTTFHGSNQLVQDFTNDQNILHSQINSIKSGIDGTSFNAALIEDPAGALQIAANGKYKKFVIILTDGGGDGNYDLMLQMASFYDITVFAVIINGTGAEVLYHICSATGGILYPNIKSADLMDVYFQIFQKINQTSECSIEWEQKECLLNREILISIPRYQILDTLRFSVPFLDVLPTLSAQPNKPINLGKIKLYTSKNANVKITANIDDITVDKIILSDPAFSIVDYGGTPPPFVLTKNQSRDLTFSYLQSDSNYHLTTVSIIGSACNNTILSISAGLGKKLVNNPFKIVSPNGGEIFAVGCDTNVTWKGIGTGDLIDLRYSTNAGQSWDQVAHGASDLSYKWKIPNTPSDSCIIKGTVIKNEDEPYFSFQNINENITALSWKPNSPNILVAATDKGQLFVYDVDQMKAIDSLSGFIKRINAIDWSKDGKYLAIVGMSNSIFFVDTDTWKISRESKTKLWGSINSIKWSNAGDRYATGSSDAFVTIYNSSNDSLILSYDTKLTLVYDVAWNYSDGSLYCGTIQDGIKILNLNTTALEATGIGFEYRVMKVGYNRSQNTYAGMYYYKGDEKVDIFDGLTNNLLSSFVAESSFTFHPFENGIFSCVGPIIIYFDYESNLTGTRYYSYSDIPTNWKAVSFNPLSNLLAGGASDGTVAIWDANISLISDISDSLWKIVSPITMATDVNIGRVALGSTKDTVISGFVKNIGTVPVMIKSIRLIDNNRSSFVTLSGLPPYFIQPLDSHNVEFRFIGDTLGQRTSKIQIITQNDTLIYSITGDVVKPNIQLITKNIDFGQVPIFNHKTLQKVVVNNSGVDSVLFTNIVISGPDIDQFNIINKTDSFWLPPNGGTHSLLVGFNPVNIGRTSTVINLVCNGVTSPLFVNLTGEGTNQCDPTGFTYDNFFKILGLKLVGDATNKDSIIRLTPNVADMHGAVWSEYPIKVSKGFTTEFKFSVSQGKNKDNSENSYPGADGLALVIQNNNNEMLGTTGGGIGYETIPNSLAIEFDMFANDSLQIENYIDPNGNHIAIQSGKLKPNSARHQSEAQLYILPTLFTMRSDSTIYVVRIDYNSIDKKLMFYLDYNKKPYKKMFEVSDFRIEDYVALTNGKAYIGFTSATGTSYQNHDLISWTYCPQSDTILTIEEVSLTNSKKPEMEVMISPNPARNSYSVNIFAPESGLAEINIINIFGVSVYTDNFYLLQKGSNELKLEKLPLASGAYFVTVRKDSIFKREMLIIN